MPGGRCVAGQSPISTVGLPGPAMLQGWAVASVIRAAPNEPMSTVVEPDVIGSAVTGQMIGVNAGHAFNG